MSFWLVVWLLISVTLLFFLGWTVFILIKQKDTWKKYASKHKLRFKPNGFFEAPEMNGLIDTHAVSLFMGEHSGPDARFSRKMTAIEIKLSSSMPFQGAIASGGMVELVQGLSHKEEHRPKYKHWDKSYVASGDSGGAIGSYLTEERLKVLTGLFRVKNAWSILIFKDGVFLLRVDTPDPLFTEKALDGLIKKMVAAAQVLELKKGESGRLKEDMVKRSAESISLDVDDDILEDTGLSLEDDDQDEPEEASAKPSTEKE